MENIIALEPMICQLSISTSIPQTQLKSRLKNITPFLLQKDGTCTSKYEFVVLGRDSSYFVKNNFKPSFKYTEENVFKMLEYLIDNLFVQCGQIFDRQLIWPVWWTRFSTVNRHPSGKKTDETFFNVYK